MNLLLLNTPATGGKLEQALEKLIDFGMDAGKDILIAILIYVIGRFIIRQISALVARILEKRKIETSVQTFLKSLIKILLNMILAFAIIGKLGVETTSFAALLASAGVAVGMALSGNLSNFAGGLIILIFKPFKVGDYIDGPGVSGTIKEIQIFHTILSTLDNRMIYVPNGSLSGNAVTNYSKQDKRRVEWVFGVEYGENEFTFIEHSRHRWETRTGIGKTDRFWNGCRQGHINRHFNLCNRTFHHQADKRVGSQNTRKAED